MHSLLTLLCLLPTLLLACPIASITERDGTGSVTGAGLNWYSSSLTTGTVRRTAPNAYTCYSGAASKFPPMSSWVSFNSMWQLMVADALTPIGDSNAEQTAIRNAILSVSAKAKVDARFILAVVILEVGFNVPRSNPRQTSTNKTPSPPATSASLAPAPQAASPTAA